MFINITHISHHLIFDIILSKCVCCRLLVIETEHAAVSVKSSTLKRENGVIILFAVPQVAEGRLHGLADLLDNRDDHDDFVPGSDDNKSPVERDEYLSLCVL